jgi:hypothetical protein
MFLKCPIRSSCVPVVVGQKCENVPQFVIFLQGAQEFCVDSGVGFVRLLDQADIVGGGSVAECLL